MGAIAYTPSGMLHPPTSSSVFLSVPPYNSCNYRWLEEEMATHSSVLAWRIPGTAGPGGLPSMGSHRVGHD